jgi:cell division protein FtsB
MEIDELRASIAELRKGSTLSLGMIVMGVVFLAGSVYYSATRLGPLEQDIQAKREEIAQLEAKRAELARLATAADNATRPAPSSKAQLEGWAYIGRVSESGNWAPQSDRVDSSKTPSEISTGSIVTVRSNASLVENIDSLASTDQAPIATPSPPDYFIRPGTQLKVLALQAQDSRVGGKYLWVKVRVRSEDLLIVGQ